MTSQNEYAEPSLQPPPDVQGYCNKIFKEGSHVLLYIMHASRDDSENIRQIMENSCGTYHELYSDERSFAYAYAVFHDEESRTKTINEVREKLVHWKLHNSPLSIVVWRVDTIEKQSVFTTVFNAAYSLVAEVWGFSTA